MWLFADCYMLRRQRLRGKAVGTNSGARLAATASSRASSRIRTGGGLMARHTLAVLALAALTAACAGRSHPRAQTPVAHAQSLEIPSLVFPGVDSATLDSLSALLGRIAQDSSLLSALDPNEPRTYALFRELEAAQKAFAIALATPDSTGRTLYDRLMSQADSTLRLFQELNRKAPRR